MWIFNFLPDSFFHAFGIIGILAILASMFLKRIPFVDTYYIPIRIVGFVVLCFGIFFEGAISNESVWQARVKELELKVAKAETESAEANSKLSKQLAAKDKEIALAQAELKNRIRQGAAAMDAVCKIPSDVVSILNDAARKGAKK
jgi:Na+/glutamate symporter